MNYFVVCIYQQESKISGFEKIDFINLADARAKYNELLDKKFTVQSVGLFKTNSGERVNTPGERLGIIVSEVK